MGTYDDLVPASSGSGEGPAASAAPAQSTGGNPYDDLVSGQAVPEQRAEVPPPPPKDLGSKQPTEEPSYSEVHGGMKALGRDIGGMVESVAGSAQALNWGKFASMLKNGVFTLVKAPSQPSDLSSVGQGTLVNMVANAIHGQESGGGKDYVIGPDIGGGRKPAEGPMQILPETFRQFAKAGEDIKDPEDNIRVGKRIVAHYMRQFDGNPAKVAVAYYSGPGNVNPGEGSPWKRDIKPLKGPPVSQYVREVMGRMKG